jgi:hypothetical protein
MEDFFGVVFAGETARLSPRQIIGLDFHRPCQLLYGKKVYLSNQPSKASFA